MYSAALLNQFMAYYARWAGVPAEILMSLAMIESSYNPSTGTFKNVCNSVRACGLFQLKPIALADIKRLYNIDIDPMNPIQSIVGAALMFHINRKYLQHYTNRDPDVWALVVAYNGGWTQGRNYMNGQAIGKEQQNYVLNAFNNYYRLA